MIQIRLKITALPTKKSKVGSVTSVTQKWLLYTDPDSLNAAVSIFMAKFNSLPLNQAGAFLPRPPFHLSPLSPKKRSEFNHFGTYYENNPISSEFLSDALEKW